MAAREAHVAGAERDHAIGQLELLQDGFGVPGELLVRGVRLLRVHDLHQLDLVELVLADHAARVLAAEPASERKHGEWQTNLSGSCSSGTISSRTKFVTGTRRSG